jgi:lipid II:glycine glycyltransferase (peptidoglycan interpeptide bridge formation enzyme)
VVTWASVPQADVDATWDAELVRFADHTLYQSMRWGRYKRIRGWRPYHFRAEANGGAVAMLQALVRRYPWRIVVAWCPGGPVGALEGCTRAAMEHLADLLGARFLYCRCTFARTRTAYDDRFLREQGWRRPARALSAALTVVWDLRQSEEELLVGLNRNWRYSLRQAHRSEVAVERLAPPPVGELAELCGATHASKGVRAAAPASEVAALFEALGDRAVAYGCRNSAGQLMAFHSCAIQGRRAWELIAGTSAEGRDRGASFAALWALVRHCRDAGVTDYDLAGVDPQNTPGVASFKRWTGAREVEWLGEWEWSTSSLLRSAVEFAVRRREASVLP